MAPFSTIHNIDRFYCEEITIKDNPEIQNNFSIHREKEYNINPNDKEIYGLEQYLKRAALHENNNHLVKIYLIKDAYTKMIVGYFGLKAGFVSAIDDIYDDVSYKDTIEKREKTKQQGYIPVKASIPGIELSHFAINDLYKDKIKKETGKKIKRLGKLLFPLFIYPIIKEVYRKIGVKMFYLYAAEESKDNKLINYYKETMDLTVFKNNTSNTSYKPMRSDYDNNCIFMYKVLDD